MVAPVFRELYVSVCLCQCFRIVSDSAGFMGVTCGPTLVVGYGITLFCCFVVLCSSPSPPCCCHPLALEPPTAVAPSPSAPSSSPRRPVAERPVIISSRPLHPDENKSLASLRYIAIPAHLLGLGFPRRCHLLLSPPPLDLFPAREGGCRVRAHGGSLCAAFRSVPLLRGATVEAAVCTILPPRIAISKEVDSSKNALEVINQPPGGGPPEVAKVPLELNFELNLVEQKKQKLFEIKTGLEDAEALIQKMDLEARTLQPNMKAMLLAKLRECKSDLNNLKSEVQKDYFPEC
ncbi:hypothetical protein Taro_009659 [Colocasia esculenta]|uniref:Vesicle transport v-SNARE N-terminal domain-containing protein n=1 Tax=Colocasia esculenta TaxID=4460 RepID=A0A843U758_COLES|nr:hypothetical protein [Colocasia esculenta]